MRSGCVSLVLIQEMGERTLIQEIQESGSQISENIKAPEEILKNRFQSHIPRD